jgi:DNA-binding transcriptional regulator YdaS (Cro superfamily)
MITPIQKAIAAVGGNKPLADVLGVSPGLVSQWSTGRLKVDPKHCIAIEKSSDGAATRYQLRPDVFGDSAVDLDSAA